MARVNFPASAELKIFKKSSAWAAVDKYTQRLGNLTPLDDVSKVKESLWSCLLNCITPVLSL